MLLRVTVSTCAVGMANTYPGFSTNGTHSCVGDAVLAETTRQLLDNSL